MMKRLVMMLMRVRVKKRQRFDKYDPGEFMKTAETRVGE
jgi:hypothetical protein